MMLITYDTAEAETNLMVEVPMFPKGNVPSLDVLEEPRSGLKKQLYHLALLQRDNSWAEIDRRSKI